MDDSSDNAEIIEEGEEIKSGNEGDEGGVEEGTFVSWIDAAAEWAEYKNPNGEIYFWNVKTGETCWERPVLGGEEDVRRIHITKY